MMVESDFYYDELSQEQLIEIMNTKEWEIRENVALRIDKKYLLEMMDDECWCVRWQVARRIDKNIAVLIWATDENDSVRQMARYNVLGGDEKIYTRKID
jgi:spore coat protein CotF